MIGPDPSDNTKKFGMVRVKALKSLPTPVTLAMLKSNKSLSKNFSKPDAEPLINSIFKLLKILLYPSLTPFLLKGIAPAFEHKKVLNSTKGQAVRATRVQTDRELYKAAIQDFLSSSPNLTIKEGSVIDLDIKNSTIKSVITEKGEKIFSNSVILTTGTFLGGVMHTGLEQSSGGRIGDPSSDKLAQKLRGLNLKVGRLKTGTPPRLNKHSIDWSLLSPQPGDTPTPLLSYTSQPGERPEQLNCYMTRTNQTTHQVILNHLDESPMYSGVIEGVGPRYCPSIEDKVMRFSERDSHQIFAEPEGLNSDLIYPNGISTSLPLKAQKELIKSIKGFENAKIVRPGYAIEYDFFDPTCLKHSLETKIISGLFFAGQINGTTGYEEAAAQGLIAGINAALSLKKMEPFILDRSDAYIGVMIDDLVTKGVAEPYRMFTSRAEYRLSLRSDNADLRLTQKGINIGLILNNRKEIFEDKFQKLSKISLQMSNLNISPSKAEKFGIKIAKDGVFRTAEEILTQKDVNMSKIRDIWPEILNHGAEIDEQIEINSHYRGYLKKQKADILAFKRDENLSIPDNIDYDQFSGLSNEVKAKFKEIRPKTMGQALRIDGITPAAVYILLSHVKRKSIKHIA